MGEIRQDLTKVKMGVQRARRLGANKALTFGSRISRKEYEIARKIEDCQLSTTCHREGVAPCIDDNMDSVARLLMIA